MKAGSILLIPVGQIEKSLLTLIAEETAQVFQQKVEVDEYYLDLSKFYDPTRRQYNATKLMAAIDNIETQAGTKKIGLLTVDLFIPILTYIFGQAKFNGNTGVVSLYRLRNELYGLKENKLLLSQRFGKVVLHELGHAFGLIHCHVPSCLMNSSTYVEDLDQKNAFMCKECKDKLGL